ncbi:S-adenosyl-L-methionine-dependent methyltransferase [Karstenula rhodostoma CBS 690.94]|uniref:S-adenosyl-L-methionine-dependent methyltransferase n=1 Tax=Karstenula rhodostoma CBS 690.94 TaxID=1392251 RepID=A0A9P4PFI9_9PLEO|nr:S-adenosyl-L-methionine-dependent methyltransferase [Karstenula rhodostoma CBS 690.94]
MAAQPQKPDWSATQYLKFATERTLAVHDLIARVRPHVHTASPRIYDLGCGPGNSTAALLAAFPGARTTGMDSSGAMLSRATAAVPKAAFEEGDLATFDTPAADVVFSNAAFHWLRSAQRMPALQRYFRALRRGGVLAVQVPDNYDAATHRLMREVAGLRGAAWASFFEGANIGDVGDARRPDLDPVEAPGVFYDALVPWAGSVHVWRTEYYHVLEDAGAIVEWVKGTGLQPYLQRIGDEGAKEAFLEEYERRLAEAYPELKDGKVLLGYPRLFVVAVRK